MCEGLEIGLEKGAAAELSAAQLWAAATGVRDQLPVAPLAEEKLSGIHRALSAAGTTLHIARKRSEPAGFYLLVPNVSKSSIELLYLAVAPKFWASGVGQALLTDVARFVGARSTPGEKLKTHEKSASRGRPVSLAQPASVELWVIAGNARAIKAYTKAGWVMTRETKIRNSAGRIELRMILPVGGFNPLV